jgi:hypothetical protein
MHPVDCNAKEPKMINRLSLLLIFQFAIFGIAKSQIDKEFEGVITYSHQTIALQQGYDVEQDYKVDGKESKFYYKKGYYKWLFYPNCYVEMEMFHAHDTVIYLKFQPNDTLYVDLTNIPSETILEYKIFPKADTILGYVCDRLTIKAKGKDSEWTRQYSYSDKFPLDPIHYKKYTHNSLNFIYSLIKALPLKIELIYKDRRISYTATQVEAKNIPNDIFFLREGTILGFLH